jgi:hypothetical protein
MSPKLLVGSLEGFSIALVDFLGHSLFLVFLYHSQQNYYSRFSVKVKSFLLAFPALPAADVIPFKGLGYGDVALATATAASHCALLILQPWQH